MTEYVLRLRRKLSLWITPPNMGWREDGSLRYALHQRRRLRSARRKYPNLYARIEAGAESRFGSGLLP